MEDPNDGRKMDTLPIVSNIHNHALRQTNEHVPPCARHHTKRKRFERMDILDPRRISGPIRSVGKPAVTGEEPT